MKQKIMILVNHDVVIYNFRKELVEILIKQGYEVLLCFPKGRHVEYFEKMGCQIIDVEINRRGSNPFTDYKLYKQYSNILKKYNPDLVLTYTIKPNIYGVLAGKKQKIKTISTITGIGNGFHNDNFTTKIIKKMYSHAFKHVQHVFFQNKENLDYFIKNNMISEEKTSLVNGSGVNTNEYTYSSYKKNNKDKKIIFVGRVMKEKGVEEFLETAKKISSRYSDVSFHIYGMKDDPRINLSHTEEFVSYHGMKDDVKSVIYDSYCVVLPSYHEGMSNVLLESAAIGRVTVASDIPGCKEIVDDGITGFLIPPRDVIGLTNAIEKVIKMDTKEVEMMGKLASDKVSSSFNRSDVVKKYVKKIQELLED